MGEEKPAERIAHLEPLIFAVRDRRVILDSDLASVYGVPTKALNQAVKRNSNRFPEDFAFQLDDAEAADLRSQFVTSRSQPVNPEGVFPNRSQSVTGFRKHRDPAARPWVFTEHGALMAANILRSEQAERMSVYVIRRGERHEYRRVLRDRSDRAPRWAHALLDPHSKEARRAIARFHSDAEVTMGSSAPRELELVVTQRSVPAKRGRSV